METKQSKRFVLQIVIYLSCLPPTNKEDCLLSFVLDKFNNIFYSSKWCKVCGQQSQTVPTGGYYCLFVFSWVFFFFFFFLVWMSSWKFWLPPNNQTKDEDLQPTFKLSFMFYYPLVHLHVDVLSLRPQTITTIAPAHHCASPFGPSALKARSFWMDYYPLLLSTKNV